MAESLNDTIKGMISSFESDRKATHHQYAVLVAVGASLLSVGLPFLVLSWANDWVDAVALFSSLFLIAGIVLLIVGGILKNNYGKRVLDSVREVVYKTLFPGALKEPHGGFPLKTILHPGFFAEPDRYLCSDFMSGTYDGIPFEQAKYRLQKRETHSDGKGHTYTSYEDYAMGTMYHFTFERDFSQTVKVLEKQGFFAFSTPKLVKVETEYIAFNKKFLVLASDQTTVFYLLTPQIQEKIMELEGKFKGQFYLAFIGNELFIAVNDSNNSISVPWKTEITLDNMAPVVEALAIPAVFIKLLGLDKSKFQKNAGTDVS
jgi:hypothetical protein